MDQLLQTLNSSYPYFSELTFAPDGSTLASSTFDGTVRIWGIP